MAAAGGMVFLGDQPRQGLARGDLAGIFVYFDVGNGARQPVLLALDHGAVTGKAVIAALQVIADHIVQRQTGLATSVAIKQDRGI